MLKTSIDPLEPRDSNVNEPEEEYSEGAHPGICGLWQNPFYKADGASHPPLDEDKHKKVHGNFPGYVAEATGENNHSTHSNGSSTNKSNTKSSDSTAKTN